MEAGTRSRLESLYTALLSRETAAPPDVRDAGELDVHDHKDDAARHSDDVVGMAEMERHVGALAAVRAALRRIDSGVYGYCIDCGEAVPLKRLLSYPEAERCTPCQSAFEALRPT